MEVIVDGSTGLPVSDDDQHFGALLEQIRRQVEGKNRVVVSFTLDGETINRVRQDELKEKKVGAFRLLEVRTVDPIRLSADTVTLLQPYLGNLEKLHEEGSTAIKHEDLARGVAKLSQCLDGWEILMHAMRDLAYLSSVDFTTISPGTGTLEDRIRKLQTTLLRFRTALEMRETDRLGQIVDRDLAPLLREWKGVLEALPARLTR